jgi:hypothetical protein
MAESKSQTAEQKAASEFGLGELPEGWRPDEGSTIIGPVTELTTGWSDQQQSYYPIVVIHDELTDKDIAVHCFHFALKEKVTTLRPTVGERIGIRMGAKVPLKSNPSRSVQTYTVKIDGRTEDIWDKVDNPRVAAPAAQTQGRLVDVEPDAQSDDDIPF